MKAKEKEIKLGQMLDARTIRFNFVRCAPDALSIIDRDFSVFRIRCIGYENRNHLSTQLRKQNWAWAVRNSPFEKNGDSEENVSAYVMCEKNPDRLQELEKIVSKMDSVNVGKPIRDSFPGIGLTVSLQLLANSFHHRNVERMNNVLGRFLQIYKYIDYNDEKKKGIHREIVCIEYLFRTLPSLVDPEKEDTFLTFKVVTLTNVRDCRFMKFSKNKCEANYPHFVEDKYGLRIADPKSDRNNEQFIEHTTVNHSKNVITFFHSGSKSVLEKSKSANINSMLQKMNDFYPGINLSLGTIDTEVFEPNGNISNVYHNKKARSLLEGCNVDLVNLAGDEYTDIFEELKSKLAIPKNTSLDKFANDVPKTAFVLIHEPEYYSELKIPDEYEKDLDKDILQHITVEKIKEMKETAENDNDLAISWKVLAENNIENMAVKLENLCHKMLLTKWPMKNIPGENLVGDYAFAMRAREAESEDGEPKFVFSIFHQDSTFEEISLLEEDNEKYWRLYEALYTDPVNIELAVQDPNGNINLVWKTDIVTIPLSEPMADKLKFNKDNNLGQEGIASREGRNEFYPECIDIGFKKISEKYMYYFVGLVGNGVKKKFQNAVNVRKVTAYKQSKLFFSDLIPTLSVPYVRHNQSTVHPFPCKNLHEWLDKNYHCNVSAEE